MATRAQRQAARRVERAVTEGVEQGRRGLFRQLVRYDEGLQKRVNRVAERVRREVNGLSGLSRAERRRRVQRITQQRLRRLMRREEAAMRASIASAAEQGVRAGQLTAQQATTLTRISAPAADAPVLAQAVASAEEAAAIRASTFGRQAVPRLSGMLRRNATQTAREMSGLLEQALQRGDSMVEAAETLLTVEDPIVHLPQYIRDIQSAMAGPGPASEVRAAGRAAMRAARGLGTRDPRAATTLRNSASQLARAAQRGRVADIERQVNYYIRDRARYQAQRVARTEMTRAFNAGYVEATQDHPAVKGMKWNLSSSHPEADICDMYASVDIAGLGPGVYPTDGLAQLPPHPHCLCFYTAVMRSPDEIASGRDSARGRPQSYDAWMRAQPREAQETMLGPGRARAFRAGGRQGARVIGDDGQFRPLYEVQGRPAPGLRRGPPIDVRRSAAGPLLPERATRVARGSRTRGRGRT